MSPNGTLWAYATPTNIKELRNQAALISLTWRDHDPTIKAAAQQMQEIPTDKVWPLLSYVEGGHMIGARQL